ncbi:hypothetical protein DSL92_08040 [Billgrantia gudaonensis]|uniref:Uncharacterized protein n=1 Tax=Billgrantia gudaonensis TaxID=376427 RepID=A0A3S0NH02_9GAMM|nr:hypothetical protein DSL92_08040 [Halomonas gudaonensis]
MVVLDLEVTTTRVSPYQQWPSKSSETASYYCVRWRPPTTSWLGSPATHFSGASSSRSGSSMQHASDRSDE